MKNGCLLSRLGVGDTVQLWATAEGKKARQHVAKQPKQPGGGQTPTVTLVREELLGKLPKFALEEDESSF